MRTSQHSINTLPPASAPQVTIMGGCLGLGNTGPGELQAYAFLIGGLSTQGLAASRAGG